MDEKCQERDISGGAMNVRASTERWTTRKQRCSSIPTSLRITNPDEHDVIRQKVAHQLRWMERRQHELEAEEAWEAMQREEAAREFFDDEDLSCFLRPQAG